MQVTWFRCKYLKCAYCTVVISGSQESLARLMTGAQNVEKAFPVFMAARASRPIWRPTSFQRLRLKLIPGLFQGTKRRIYRRLSICSSKPISVGSFSHQPNHTKPLAPWQKRVLHRSCCDWKRELRGLCVARWLHPRGSFGPPVVARQAQGLDLLGDWHRIDIGWLGQI